MDDCNEKSMESAFLQEHGMSDKHIEMKSALSNLITDSLNQMQIYHICIKKNHY